MNAPDALRSVVSITCFEIENIMDYLFASLWHERRRFAPAGCAVCFSAILVALQSGMLLGTFSIVSIPIDRGAADLWVACPNVVSVDIARPIPRQWRSRLHRPEIERSEPYYQGFGFWRKPDGGTELVVVTGAHLHPKSLGAVRDLSPEQRVRLAETGTVVVDAADCGRLGIRAVNETAEVNGRRVRVVGLVRGLKGLSGPYLFCSLETARTLLDLNASQATFLLARTHSGVNPQEVARRLARYTDMAVFSRDDFSLHSRRHWLLETGGGLALLAAAVLGLIVGAVITSQTLYAAAAGQMKEYAVLRAMGIPRRRIAQTILAQAFAVGLAGVAVAAAAIQPLAVLIRAQGANLLLPWWLLTAAGGLTLVMATVSGLLALRSLQLSDPVSLLR